LSSAAAAASGWSLSPEEDQPSSSPCPQPGDHTPEAATAAPILVVEDNSADVDLIRYALAQTGIESSLFVCDDGDKGWRRIDDIDAGRAACPAIVILDLNLPKRSGVEVLQRIRTSTVCGHVPVLVFSSSAAEQDRRLAARFGANRYVTKPLELDALLHVGEIIKSLIEQR
jgi:DNA-binding response OmpR family regulator